MQVTYTLTADDYLEISRLGFERSSEWQRHFALCWLFPPAALTSVCLYWAAQSPLFLFGLVPVAIYLAVFPSRYRAWFDKRALNSLDQAGPGSIIGRITLILTEETFVEITGVTRTESRWEAMHGVDVEGDYTIIYVTGHLRGIIPRHGFAYEQDYEAVRNFALRKLSPSADDRPPDLRPPDDAAIQTDRKHL